MSLLSAFAIYFVVWWVTLFLVLPFGVRSQHEDETAPGTDPGAPIIARMGWRLLWTTLLSAAIFGAGVYAYRSGVTVDALSRMMGLSFP